MSPTARMARSPSTTFNTIATAANFLTTFSSPVTVARRGGPGPARGGSRVWRVPPIRANREVFARRLRTTTAAALPIARNGAIAHTRTANACRPRTAALTATSLAAYRGSAISDRTASVSSFPTPIARHPSVFVRIARTREPASLRAAVTRRAARASRVPAPIARNRRSALSPANARSMQARASRQPTRTADRRRYVAPRDSVRPSTACARSHREAHYITAIIRNVRFIRGPTGARVRGRWWRKWRWVVPPMTSTLPSPSWNV